MSKKSVCVYTCDYVPYPDYIPRAHSHQKNETTHRVNPPMIVNRTYVKNDNLKKILLQRTWQVRLMIFVKRQIVMFWIQCCCFFSSEGSSQSIQPDTFPTLNCNKVNTFWPPWFLCYHFFAVWSSCPIHSLNLWLGSSSLFSPEKFQFTVSLFSPVFWYFPSLSWDTKCQFQLSKKNQAKLSHLPSHNLYTPLPCLALKLLTIK